MGTKQAWVEIHFRLKQRYFWHNISLDHGKNKNCESKTWSLAPQPRSCNPTITAIKHIKTKIIASNTATPALATLAGTKSTLRRCSADGFSSTLDSSARGTYTFFGNEMIYVHSCSQVRSGCGYASDNHVKTQNYICATSLFWIDTGVVVAMIRTFSICECNCAIAWLKLTPPPAINASTAAIALPNMPPVYAYVRMYMYGFKRIAYMCWRLRVCKCIVFGHAYA